jgi:peptide deformylase
MLNVIKTPDSVLSQKSKRVTKIDKGIINLLEKMKVALAAASDPVGVGLAAPQVGKSLRIFIAKPTLKSKVFTFINPVITKTQAKQKGGGKKTTKLEGCLSLPNIWGEVKRFHEINVEYKDETGKKHNRKFTGFMATVVQHEIDHLNGILFPKRVLDQKGTLYKSQKDEKGEDVFEEIKI